MDVHLSIKAKLVVSAESRQELKFAMEEFNRACNTLSELAFSVICIVNTTSITKAIA
jgi:hypothetical protein